MQNNYNPEEDQPISRPHGTNPHVHQNHPGTKPQGYNFGVQRPAQNPYQANFEADARRGFIKKVYGIVCVQLLFTIALVWIFSATGANEGLVNEDMELTRAGKGVLYTSLVAIIAISLTLVCVFETARKVPTNYILLFLYTVAFGFICVMACARYSPGHVISAALNTLGITLALTAYACYSKTEITYLGALKFMLIWLVIAIPLMIVVGVNGNRFSGTYTVLQLLIIILYGFFILWDTKMIIGQKKSGNQLNMDEYILGALFLYTDIINLFLRLLGGGGGSRR
jgi:FtsH-binding integral membrane protein